MNPDTAYVKSIEAENRALLDVLKAIAESDYIENALDSDRNKRLAAAALRRRAQ